MKEKDNPYVVKFRKPYQFEGQEYTEVDLSGLDKLTVKDLVEADRHFATSGQAAVVNEMSVGYACIIAAKVTDKPVEFFENLPAAEGIVIKNMVTGFFYI
jgi:hypothetical protein